MRLARKVVFWRASLIAGVLLVLDLVHLGAAAGAPCRALRYSFTADCLRAAGDSDCTFHADRPDLGPQIAVWVESADRATFVDTLMVTNATALFGIGNRPGAWDLRSGPKFPYGRRPPALPVWAHAHGQTYPLVVMQDGQEQMLTAHEGDSSPEPHFCRPMLQAEVVDAITCPSGLFRSDKGRLDPSQVSVYPPRADLFDLGTVCPVLPNRPNGSCNPGDSERYTFLNDVDTVAAATPAFGAAAGGAWIVPGSVAPGDYALMVEVGKEFDTNASYAAPSAPSLDYAVFGTAGSIGQPSVVYRVPFTIDGAGDPFAAATDAIYGYGDWTGATGTLSPPDGSISSAPGSGAGRLAETAGPGGVGRVHVDLSACTPVDCSTQGPPAPVPIEVPAAGITATSARVTIVDVGDGEAPVAGYDIRSAPVGLHGLATVSTAEFARWTPAPAITPGPPGVPSDGTLIDLVPSSDYAVGVQARGRCGRSPVSYARFRTAPIKYQQIQGCFIATAAFGSDLAPELDVFRRLRDEAVARSGLVRLAADLYYSVAPAAARPLSESEVGRALVRGPLRAAAVIGRALLAVTSSRPSGGVGAGARGAGGGAD
jgi:hypothetical protein